MSGCGQLGKGRDVIATKRGVGSIRVIKFHYDKDGNLAGQTAPRRRSSGRRRRTRTDAPSGITPIHRDAVPVIRKRKPTSSGLQRPTPKGIPFKATTPTAVCEPARPGAKPEPVKELRITNVQEERRALHSSAPTGSDAKSGMRPGVRSTIGKRRSSPASNASSLPRNLLISAPRAVSSLHRISAATSPKSPQLHL